ncbi:MAG: S9 family peptidase [Calditrichaeota bacterium]|nr:S9 family peptidase [Calditrichota bacterium]
MSTFRPVRLVFWIFLLLFSWVGLTAEELRILQPEDVVNLKLVTEVQLSPDGKRIAYVLRKQREEGEKPGGYRYEIWLTDVEGKEIRRLTLEGVNSRSPQWHPDGTILYFLSRREPEKHTQVYALPLKGGEAYPVTRALNSVSRFAVSPDGNWLVYRVVDPETEEEKKEKEAGRDWEVFEKDYKHARLWLLNLNNGDSQVLTTDPITVWDFVWAPNSREIIFTASDKPFTDHSYMFKRIYRIHIEQKKAEQIFDPGAKIGSMQVSPDGTRLAFLAGVDQHDPASGTLFILDLKNGSVVNISGDFEGTNRYVEWWDRKRVLTVAEQGVYTNVLLWDLKKRRYTPILAEGPIFSAISFHRPTKNFAFAGNTPGHPNEVFFANRKGKYRRLTDSNPWLKEVRLAPQEVISWTARDGLEIQGILIKPLDFQEGQRYPLIVQIHGGPESAYHHGWVTYYSRWSQLLAARGYMVLMPNYRASTGRGVNFAKADHKDLAGAEFNDVLDGIDYLIKKGWVDRGKVGIGGGSYGGYFSAWAATRHSERFAASVVFAGISNWISFTGTTDIPRENSLVHWAMFWLDSEENEQLAWERSPLAHVRNARTPTLICHGDRDLRVPIGQGYELYRALEMRNVPVEFVIYPREPHGLLEREHQLDFIKRVLAWYDKYVKGQGSGE